MTKCIFVSFFNSNNIGDILITKVLMQDIENSGYTVEKCSYEGSFEITNRYDNSQKYSPVISKIINKIKYIIFWKDYNEKIRKTDVLIIGGGNMIMDLTEKAMSGNYFAKYINIAKKYKKKVVVLSIGVGPFQTETQRLAAESVLKQCDFVTFRDKDSFDLVGDDKCNHYITADPVFTLKQFNIRDKVKKKKKIIGVGVINTLLFDSSIERYNIVKQGYINLSNRLVELGYEVVLFSTECSDSIMAEDVYNARESTYIRFVKISNINDLAHLYSTELSLIISARMHSLIIGFTQFIPIIGLSWQQKVLSMFELIEQSDHCFDIDYMDNNLERIINLVEFDISDNHIKQKYKDQINKIADKYYKNIHILNSVKKSLT